MVTEEFELLKPGMHLKNGSYECSRARKAAALRRRALRGFERVVRSTRTWQTFAVRAGGGRGHHRNGCHSREGSCRFYEEDLPEDLPIRWLSERKNGRIFGNRRQPVFPGDIDLHVYDSSITGLKGEDAGDHLPERHLLIHDKI